jgi:hypothetical protein
VWEGQGLAQEGSITASFLPSGGLARGTGLPASGQHEVHGDDLTRHSSHIRDAVLQETTGVPS